ncbi:MAG: ATP-binding cassette domain-containing protein [Candidatus Magnetoovum sp. WYHC-5]|nr:ATP-binding cassette domain-containing protein [Candidatus Magnetoovum sp. WYHC-5]
MDGALTVGAFGSIITSIYLVFSPIKQIGESYTSLQRINAAIERIEYVLHTNIERSGTQKLDKFTNGITFVNVSFSYLASSSLVINNVSIHIETNELLAIVGPSGAGKTTFVSLIPRFYDVLSGSIKIDGVDIREYKLEDLRSLMGIVSQDIMLFNDTIKENISFGKPNADFKSIKEAAALAYADEFIDKLPDGYDTVIGERGLNLSGGQRQRIAIARAILKNPPILILDEATSSLDSVSESLVQQALEKLMKNRTTIVIAHRLSTIKNANRIVVIEDGMVKDIGKHDELITINETYMKLYNIYTKS